jgi:hypothetical protein
MAEATSAEQKLNLARHHLERVLDALPDPTDWDDLALYGFYCLEAAVEAAALHVGSRTTKRHWEKADIAAELHGIRVFRILHSCYAISMTREKPRLTATRLRRT